MVSPDMFRDFFLDDLAEYCRMLDYPVYHLDGPGAVKHLDSILEISDLRVIQWTPGAGAAPLSHWIPMLREIQAAGKGIFLYANPNELDLLMENPSYKGIIVNLWASSPEEADTLVSKALRWR